MSPIRTIAVATLIGFGVGFVFVEAGLPKAGIGIGCISAAIFLYNHESRL